MIETQLFTDKDFRLTAIDPETDSTAESTWTNDLRYAALAREGISRPLPAFGLKNKKICLRKPKETAASSISPSTANKITSR